jgi:hypothetical protein
MALAFQMYTQDYDEKFTGWVIPAWDPAGCNRPGTTYWYHHIWYPYVKNWQVFICPSTQWNSGANCNWWVNDPEIRAHGTSYGFELPCDRLLVQEQDAGNDKAPFRVVPVGGFGMGLCTTMAKTGRRVAGRITLNRTTVV